MDPLPLTVIVVGLSALFLLLLHDIRRAIDPSQGGTSGRNADGDGDGGDGAAASGERTG